MSSITPAPYKLTDTEIASVMSSNTVSAKLTDAGIAAALSSATVGAKMAGVSNGAIGSTTFAKATGANRSAGATLSGSSLYPATVVGDSTVNQAAYVDYQAGSLSGTWLLLGSTSANQGKSLSLFQRIA
ncbi:hypothetical protein [Thioclava nitratireducens]|uniref:hypothetical protein n=1 Tax=Thioclava nitratireducens TaxID=1915078 RepID=UPI00248089DC|nr:hypothetical protein [Thioclava nitratireducens]WGT50150.1 hypothetical protein P0N61_17890 [Thioclava nitratireducens]